MVQAWIVEGLIIIFIGAFVVAAFIKLVRAIRGLLKKENHDEPAQAQV